MDEPGGPPAAPGHEQSDVPARPLAQFAVALAAFVAAVFVGIVVLYKLLGYYQPMLDPDPHPLAATRQVGSGPRIELDPPRGKAALRQVEDHILGTYDWVDREHGRVRIPIDRAMAIIATTGLPAPVSPSLPR